MIHWKKISVELPPPGHAVIVKMRAKDLLSTMARNGDFDYIIAWLEPPANYKFASPNYQWMNERITLDVDPNDEWVLLQ